MIRLLCYSLGLVFFLSIQANADVVVSEVLAYAPSDSAALEWIELYNDSPDSAIYEYNSITVVDAAGNPIDHSVGGPIAGETYLILCRNAPLFEVRWGDGSGIWGDSPEEDYVISQTLFVLDKDSGSVAFKYLTQEISKLTWSHEGLESHSWERVHPTSDRIEQSVDSTGSTPGRKNSVATLAMDLALEDVAVTSDNGLTNLSYTIVNRGLNTVNDDSLHLYYYDVNATDSLGAWIASEAIGPVDTGYTIILIGQYSLPGVYPELVAELNDDDRNTNNRFIFAATGQEYPPVILSEFLANPETGSNTEWVEIKNRSTQTVDLMDWQLGDSLGLAAITDASLNIEPGHYLVLAWDSVDFLNYYTEFSHDLAEPASWKQLNNGSDIVRLVDALGIEADSFHYTDIFDDNHTWARAESGERAGEWGRSGDSGGTPGETNRVQFSTGDDTGLELSILPRIISPDGDGRDDQALISLSRPEAGAYTLRIYDKMGRLVRTFEDDLAASHYTDQYIWDGTNNSHERLPIGIYIVYFEASGVESLKTTVAIAR